MNLFVSDIHFGKLSESEEMRKEAELISMIKSYEDKLDNLFIVGDLFHEFMEYKTLVPKGNFRFLTYLDDLITNNVSIYYFLGNRDPWHLDFFRDRLKLKIVPDYLNIELDGTTMARIQHGDDCAPSTAYKLARPIMRNRFIYWMYRSLMPGDSAFRVARKVSNLIANEEPMQKTIEGMRNYATEILDKKEANLVVMGHSHFPEQVGTINGVYVNLGSWADNRSYAILNDNSIELTKWNDDKAKSVVSMNKPTQSLTN